MMNDGSLKEAIEWAKLEAGNEGTVYICHGSPRCHVNLSDDSEKAEAFRDECRFCYRLPAGDQRDVEEIIQEMSKFDA